MKKKTKILCLLGCLSGVLHAQSNIVASGGDASGSGGSVNYTIGQIDFMTKTGTSGVMTEGVQQPYEILTDVSEKEFDVAITIFPNPTSGLVEVEISDSDVNLNYELLDITGRVIKKNKFLSNSNEIDMSSLSNGVYYLKVSKDENLQKAFTIIKNY